MFKKTPGVALLFLMICSLAACGTTERQNTGAPGASENSSYESVEGIQIRMRRTNRK